MALETLFADPTQLALMAVALLVAGVIAGVLAGLLGIGGGIVIVPLLFHVFTVLGVDESVRMHVAVGTSLATIVATSLSSVRAHARRGAVDFPLLRRWAPGILLGVAIGSWVGGELSGRTLSAIFATLALFVALRMAFGKAAGSASGTPPRLGVQWVIAAGIGGLSAMMGIGGGALTVPVLSAFGFAPQRAVATSSAVGLLLAVPGTVGFTLTGFGEPGLPPLSLGYVSVIGAAFIIPCTVLAAPLGAKLAHAVPSVVLKRVFAVFLLFTAVRMFYELAS